MIAHGKDIKIFAGNSNRVLAQEICQHLNTKLGDSEVGKFADGECYASLYESVRGSDVFVIQSTCNPVNDNLMEMLVMIDALKRASAGRITAVIPYFGYARQDRKAKARDPISAKLVANMIVAAGADRALSLWICMLRRFRAFSIFLWTTCWAILFSWIITASCSARRPRRWWSFLRTSVPCPAPALLPRNWA